MTVRGLPINFVVIAGVLLYPSKCALAAATYIDMGPAPLLGAYDQPFVRFEIGDEATSFGPRRQLNQFLLDTGATSILVVASAADDLRRSSGSFAQGDFLEQGVGGFTLYDVSADYTVSIYGNGQATLEAGDADQDLRFDQRDIVQVMQQGKYLTGRPAAWGEGDWASAAGGTPGRPATGDGVFDQQDIVAALQHGLYNRGPYATLSDDGAGIRRSNVRILSDPFQSFGELTGFEGIVGMPAMVDRVTTLDMTSTENGGFLGVDFSNLDDLIDSLAESSVSSSIGVSFSHTLPPSRGHRYAVTTRALHFDPTEPDPVPTAAPLPVVTASHHVNGLSVSGDNYIVDTGAQLSFISLDKARRLGLDPDDPFSTIDVQGVGGIKPVPVFYLESLSLMTEEGVELYWRDVQVIGLDLDPSIDGVIGSDLLTAGLLETDLQSLDFADLLAVGEGPIQQVHFDFRTLQQDTKDGRGKMYFDLNPDFNVVRQGPFEPQVGGDDLDGIDDLNDPDLVDLISDLFDFVAVPGDRSHDMTLGPADLEIFSTLVRQYDTRSAVLTDAAEVSLRSGGGRWGDVDFVHVPEPSASVLGMIGVLALIRLRGIHFLRTY